jgi:N-acetylmuramoyl-L-alanine amidase
VSKERFFHEDVTKSDCQVIDANIKQPYQYVPAKVQIMHDEIVRVTGAKPRGIYERDDLTGFNWSTQPTVLIEAGFLSNNEEDMLLNDSVYQDRIVEGIVNGVIIYFDNQR